ncbi:MULTISPECIES: transglycosylase SLT domain-containing protein [Bacillus amyloliquefaciens group]|uniref:transglycosylase SLT domain-containing protein n=1 Tax=Bacillus amyloliquefaciens group TaxID=1938374 RepID=UPI0031F54CB1
MANREELVSFVATVGMDGTGVIQGAKGINAAMAAVRSELTLTASQTADFGNSLDGLKAKQENLGKMYQLQGQKVQQLRARYDELVKTQGEYSEETLRAAAALNTAQARYNKLGRQLKDTTAELQYQQSQWKKTSAALSDFSDSANKLGDNLSKVGKVASVGLTAPLTTLGAVAIKTASDVEKSTGRIQAALGLTSEEAKEVSKAANNIWTQGFGESTHDAETAIVNVRHNIETLKKASVETTKEVAKNTMVISETFDEEGNDITKAINSMQNSFDNLSVDKSMDLITTGFQRGLNYSDEFLDSINEYSNQFAAADFSVNKMFSIFQAGAETGAFQLDKVGDLVKEMNIRLSDGSAGDAMKSLSKHTQNLYKEFKKTGKGGDEVFTSIMKDIDGMSNKSKAYTLGQAIMGTQFEDLGQKGVSALAKVTDSFNNVEGATDKAGKALKSSLSDRAAKDFRELQASLVPLGEVMLDTIEPGFKVASDAVHKFTDWMNGLSPAGRNSVIAIAGLAAVVPPLTIALGAVIRGVGSITGAMSNGIAAMGRYRAQSATTSASMTALGTAATVTGSRVERANARINGATKGMGKLRGASLLAGGAMTIFGGKWGAVLGIATTFLPEIIQGGKSLFGFGENAKKSATHLTGFGGKAKTATQAASGLAGEAAQTAGKFGGLGGKALGLVSGLGGVARGASLLRLGLGALGGPVGLAITGVTLLTEAGIKLNEHMQKDTIPTLDSFGDKVSESTTKSVLAYKNLNDKATEQLNQLNWSGQKVSKEAADNITKNFDQMGDKIKASIKTKGDQSYKALGTFLESSKSLSKKEQESILNNVKQKQSQQTKEVDKNQKQIQLILNKASNEKRSLTKAEQEKINSIQNKMMTTAVKTMSKSEVEQKAILGKLKNESSNITARQAADTIKNSIKARDGSVKEAEKKYDKTVAAIIRERDETGSISKEQADKMIKEAKKQRDDSVKAAKDMHKKVVKEAKAQAGEHADEIDEETGDVKNGWDMMMDKVGSAWSWIKGIFSGEDKSEKPKESKKSAPKTAGRSLGGAQKGAYARGTSNRGHSGGLAIVGEKGRELIHEPGVGTYLSGNKGSELRNLNPGTSVLPNKQTERLLKSHGFPGYEGGVGQYFDWIMKGAGFLWDKAAGMFGIADSIVPDWFTKISGSPLKAIGGLAKTGIDSLMDTVGTFFGGGGTAAVKKWVAEALKIKGLGSQFAGALETIAMQESGGNPNSINLWDSNAKAGHPSQGLMQFIPSTFNAHKEPGYGNIKNPVHQVLAAINYTNSRYGGIMNHPGLKSMANGGGYVGYESGGTSPGTGGSKLAMLNERGYDEHIITSDPKYRERNIGIWAQAGKDLGLDTSSNTPRIPSIESITSRQDVQINQLKQQINYLKGIYNSIKEGMHVAIDFEQSIGKKMDQRSNKRYGRKALLAGVN